MNIEFATFESHVCEQTIVWTSERTQVPWGSTGAFYVKTLSISVWSGVTLMLIHLQDCKLEEECFLTLTILTSFSNANACKNLGWTLHKDFELCTKATWVDNGTVRANLSPHIQCFGSLGCLSFVKSFIFTCRKDKRDSSPPIESCMCDHLSSGHSLCRENCTRFAPDFGRICFISTSCFIYIKIISK